MDTGEKLLIAVGVAAVLAWLAPLARRAWNERRGEPQGKPSD